MSNIVKAVFTDSRNVSTIPIFAQKYGQILQIEGLELPGTFEVDFCNAGDLITTPQVGSNNQVSIPDICLKSCRPIKAYIVLHSGSNDGGTEYEIDIPLKYRPEHGYEEPEDVQQDVITTTIAALNNAVEESSNNAASAAASAAEAAASASMVPNLEDTIGCIHGLFGASVAGVTERVDGGTKILNKINAARTTAQLGFYYNQETDKLSVHAVFGEFYTGEIADLKFYGLRCDINDGITEPYELTMENCPHVGEQDANTGHNLYKTRTTFSNISTRSPLDIRYCTIAYDKDGNELHRSYSAQYRYTLNESIVTRTRFTETEPQSPEIIEDAGLIKITKTAQVTYGVKTSNTELLPLVYTDQNYEYDFIIPDEMFDNAPLGYNMCVRVGDGSIYEGPRITKAKEFVEQEKITRLFGGASSLGSVVTERVEDGTKILNAFLVPYAAAQLGYYYDPENNRLSVYNIFSNDGDYSENYISKCYAIFEKNSESEPYEFTIENAPDLREVAANDCLFKYKINIGNITSCADLRLVTVAYDANGNEINRIYSTQFRYTVENGVCTRTIVPTEPTNSEYVVNIGIWKNGLSLRKQFLQPKYGTASSVLPLVYTNQDAQYEFIIPDAMFDNAPNGYSLAVVDGEGLTYLGPSFNKAKAVVEADQGIVNAGKFLVVGNDGMVVPTSMALWQGGSY